MGLNFICADHEPLESLVSVRADMLSRIRLVLEGSTKKSGRALPTHSGLPGCRDNAVTNTNSSTHGLDKGRQ